MPEAKPRRRYLFLSLILAITSIAFAATIITIGAIEVHHYEPKWPVGNVIAIAVAAAAALAALPTAIWQGIPSWLELTANRSLPLPTNYASDHLSNGAAI